MHQENVLGLPAGVDALLTSLHGFLEQELDYLEPTNRHARAVLLHELGNIEELVLGDRAQAGTRYQEALELDPSFVPVLRAMRRIHASEGQWREYLAVLEKEIRVTRDEATRADLLARHGELLAARLADTESAIRSLKAAVNLSPSCRRGVELLRTIYGRLERWNDLSDVLRQLTNTTADPVARSRLTVELAEIAEFRLGQPSAAEELYAHALELDPTNEKAAVALRRLLNANERWKELGELLATEAGREHEPDEMFADLYRAARIAEVHLQDDARAASLLETAAALRPHDPLPLAPLTEIYGRTGRYADQAAVLGRRLRLVRDQATRAAICYRLGRVAEDWLDNLEQATDVYRQALQHQPNHEAAIRALVNLYRALERWEELLDLELLRAERYTDSARRAAGYLTAAQICERRLDDLPRAVDLYDRAWRVQPGLSEAFRALDRIYRLTDRWDALVELYERKAELTKDRALAVSLLRDVGWIYEEKLQNRERAVVTLEKLHEERPEDRDVLIRLARLYEDLGRMDELRRALEKWAEVTEDELERTDLRRRIGELLEGPLRKIDRATDAYQSILQATPSDRPTRERLKAIYERSGRWNDLVETLAGELQIVADVVEVAPLQFQIGRLCEDKLGDLSRAEKAYESALEADPQYTPALLALEELYRRRGLWERLVKLLNSQAERIRDPSSAAALMCRAGEICEERLRDGEQAELFYNRTLELEPSNTTARQGLERLYLASDDRRALEAHYLREAEEAVNPALRVRAYLRLGSLFEGPGEDSVGAAAAYESALKVVEDQPDALHSLASLYRRTSKWDRLADLLARIAANADDRGVAVSALKEWASVVEQHLSERWDPAPILERILDADPQDVHALSQLEIIAYERRDLASLLPLTMLQVRAGGEGDAFGSLSLRAGVLLLAHGKYQEATDVLHRGLDAAPDCLPLVRLLRRVHEKRDEWREAANLLMREGELASTPEAAGAAMVKAGNVLADRFGDTEGARRAFDRVLGADPSHELAFGRMTELLSEAEDWQALIDLYRSRLSAVEAREKVPLQLELAQIYRENLRDSRTAIEVLEELLESDPINEEALSDVADLCISLRRWREAEDYLERLARSSDDGKIRRKARLQQAIILEEQLGGEDQALEVLQGVLEEAPDDREALGRLMKIFQRRGDWERTVQVLAELSRKGPPIDRINGMVDLAEIYSRSLNVPEKARKALTRAARTCVESGQGMERISEYFERRGDFEGLVTLFGDALDKLPPEGSAGSVSVRLALARVLAGRLLRPDDAEVEIRRALTARPDSIEARLELAALHLWGDNLGEATAEYMRVLEKQPFAPEGYRGLYRVYERRGDLSRAAAAAQVIRAIGEPETEERKLAEEAESAMERVLSSITTAPLQLQEFWRLIAHPDEPQIARELLHAVSEYVPAVLPDEVERAAEGHLIPLDEGERLAARCMMLGQAFGMTRFQVCIGRSWPKAATAIPGNPPRLVIDERFAKNAGSSELRFGVGRALSMLLTSSMYLEVLKPRKIEVLLAAVVEPFERGFGEYLGTPRQVEEMARLITRAVPRKMRRSFEEPARSYVAGQPAAVAAWRKSAQRTAERGGLLLAGDVGAAITVLRSEGVAEGDLAELLKFAVGPHLHEAQRRLGVQL